MDKYRMLGKKGEGTFSEVFKCQNIKDGTYWAAKKMKQQYSSADQLKDIREIQALRQLSNNAHILQLQEVIFEKRAGTLCLIFELMDMNLYELIRGQRNFISNDKVCKYMYQLLKAIDHMHRHGYFHRDIKPENILIKDDSLKLADFGSCRKIHSKHPFTEYISTRWYRAPECLLTDGYYSYQMDIWSVGCVMFEIITLHPLFPGANEIDQVDKIHDVIGTPDPSILEKFKNKSRTMRFDFKQKRGVGISRYLPNSTQDVIELINLLCTYDPEQRITAHKALKHVYFDSIRAADKNEQNNKTIEQKANKISQENERNAKTSEDRYTSDEEGSSRLDILSIPASEPYKSIIKRKKKYKYKDYQNINGKNNNQIYSNANSSSNSVLSHYSAATSVGSLNQTHRQNNHHNGSSVLLPKLGGSTSSIHYASFPSPTFQNMFTRFSDNSVLPTVLHSSAASTISSTSSKAFGSTKGTNNGSKTLYKNYFPTLTSTLRKKNNFFP